MFAKSFFDLCVPQKCLEGNNCQSNLKLLYEFGYRTIAINHEVQDQNTQDDADENENKKKKKKSKLKEQNEIIPEPMKIEKTVTEEFEDLTILKRLTITFSSRDSFHKILKSENFKKYDILALLPTTMSALMFVCSNVDGDILTIDPETKSPLRINRKIYNQLVNKGYFFEILYSPTIEDYTKRKNTIHISHLYHTFGKSKNIIISSGAPSSIYFRSPYDIINLGAIFGLNGQQAKDSITHCPSNLCKKAVGRCHGKSIMFVENIAPEDHEPSLIEIIDIDLDSDADTEVQVNQPTPKKKKKKT